MNMNKNPTLSKIDFSPVEKTSKTKLHSFTGIQELILAIKATGQSVGLCHGCFDVFHFGHLRHLESASSFCDFLIVSVTSDRFVKKGKNRPVFRDCYRAEVLAGLQCVDAAVISDYSSAVKVITSFQPNMFFKGQEYQAMELGANPSFIEEQELAASFNIDVIFTQEERFSSTQALQRLWNPKND